MKPLRGMTLLELVVVIGVIVMLTAVAVFEIRAAEGRSSDVLSASPLG